MIAYIDANAGLIWNALDKLGKTGVRQLKKATKVHTGEDVYTALGRLAKGEKLTFVYEDGTSLTSLR